jgi:hypothetical protein
MKGCRMRIVNNLARLLQDKRQKHQAETGVELSEIQMAVYMGINPATLSHYKNGKVESVNWEVWQKMVKYFGVAGHEIFDVLPDEDET